MKNVEIDNYRNGTCNTNGNGCWLYIDIPLFSVLFLMEWLAVMLNLLPILLKLFALK